MFKIMYNGCGACVAVWGWKGAKKKSTVFYALTVKKQIAATFGVIVLFYFIYIGNDFSLFDAQSKKSGNISFLAAHFIYMPGQAKYFKVRAKPGV